MNEIFISGFGSSLYFRDNLLPLAPATSILAPPPPQTFLGVKCFLNVIFKLLREGNSWNLPQSWHHILPKLLKCFLKFKLNVILYFKLLWEWNSWNLSQVWFWIPNFSASQLLEMFLKCDLVFQTFVGVKFLKCDLQSQSFVGATFLIVIWKVKLLFASNFLNVSVRLSSVVTVQLISKQN